MRYVGRFFVGLFKLACQNAWLIAAFVMFIRFEYLMALWFMGLHICMLLYDLKGYIDSRINEIKYRRW